MYWVSVLIAWRERDTRTCGPAERANWSEERAEPDEKWWARGERRERIVRLGVRPVDDAADLALVRRARRALVYVDSPMSAYGGVNGEVFLSGVATLRVRWPGLRVSIFWVGNDAEDWCKDWARSLNEPDLLGLALPLGYGATLWLERGKVVQFELGGSEPGMKDVEHKTARLWGPSAHRSQTK
jgi:hypothetical protein